MQQENFEPPHYAVRTRGGCSYKTRTTGRANSSSPIAARGLDVPRKRVPPGCSAPALRLRCLRASVGELGLANPSQCNPGRDEHQLVRDAAGGLAHRATRRTTLFAPGAGAPTRLRCPEGASLSPPYTRKMM